MRRIKQSIGIRLLRIVFSIYLVIAVSVTVLHMVNEYNLAYKRVVNDLRIFQKNMTPSIGVAFWNADIEQLESILNGIVEHPMVIGVLIEDIHGNQVGEIGQIITADPENRTRVENGELMTWKSGRTKFISYQYPIIQPNDDEHFVLGAGRFFTSSSVVFQNVRQGFISIIISAVIKTLFLWIIFIVALKIILERPLFRFKTAVGRLDPDNLEPIDISLSGNREDELTTLEAAFNKMVVNLKETRKKLIDRKKAEIRIKQSETKYRTMMESLVDAVYVCSPEKKIEYMNPAMVKRLGRDETGESCYKAMHGLDHQCDWCNFDTLKEKRLNEITVVSPLDNRTYRISSMPFVNVDNTVSKMTVYKDITDFLEAVSEKEKAQAMLIQAQKLESIGTLAGGIAHDFNNILTPIIGFTELSVSELSKTHPVQENLKDILNGAKRARDLVKQILSFSRRHDSERLAISLSPLIDETLSLLRSTLPSNIVIKKELAKDIYIYANPTQIHEVVMNLSTNAFHSMDKNGGTLSVSLSLRKPDSKYNLPSGKYCCIETKDTGTGISPEIINNIFDPYFTTKEQGKGSGLGLSVIHGIVKTCGGAIDIKSELSEGTCVRVFFPLALKPDEPVDTIEYMDGEKGKERILFVDDEDAIVKLVSRTLKRLGYSVQGETDSQKALQIFEKNPDDFDMMITDMTMPTLQGIDLAKKVLRIKPGIPIIICTGFSEHIDQKAAESNGVKGFLLKPILLKDLSTMVRKLFDDKSD